MWRLASLFNYQVTTFQVIYPIIFCAVSYTMTGQLLDVDRILYFMLINIIMAFVSQSLGLLLGAVFMEVNHFHLRCETLHD